MIFNVKNFPVDDARIRWLCWIIAPAILFIPFIFVSPISFFGTFDAVFYTNILALLTHAVHSGEFFPRWLADANNGMGSPVMLFYTPLAYLVTTLITLPLVPFHMGIESQFLISIYASQIFSGYAAWLWLKSNFPPRIAFIGSLFFVLAPYKLIYIFEHMNMALLWAVAFLPLWMLAAQHMLQTPRRAMGLYACVAAAVYYTHPLTAFAFSCVPACYVLWFGRGNRCYMHYAYLAAAHFLAAGLCFMQAWPQYHYLSWIHANEYISGQFSWRQNLYHIDIMLCAYYGIIAAMVVFAVMRIPAIRSLYLSRVSLFWTTVLGAVLFMTLPVSSFLWEHITPLQYLQFPAGRLHSLALMAATFLLCSWLTYRLQAFMLAPTGYRVMTCIVLIALFTGATACRLLYIYATPNSLTESYESDVHNAKILATLRPIYETQWGCADIDRAFSAYEMHLPIREVEMAEGKGNMAVELWQPPQHIILTADIISKQAFVNVRQCYVPAWKAYDENGNLLDVSASPSDGLIEIALPKGHHRINISFVLSDTWQCSVSAVFLLICAALVLWPKKWERHAI